MLSHGAEEALWAQNVDEEKGWYDFDKAPGRRESGLCWAITAANLIAWWQDCREAQLPKDVPTGHDVWQTYKRSFTNNGSDPDEGIRWWYCGQYEPQSPPDGTLVAKLREGVAGAFYGEDGEKLYQSVLYRGRGKQVNAASLMRVLYDGFRAGHAFWIGVSYTKPNGGRSTHSLTLWGAVFETAEGAAPRVVAVYIADSDDGCRQLHRIDIQEKNGMLQFHCPDHPLYGQIKDIVVDTYSALRAQ